MSKAQSEDKAEIEAPTPEGEVEASDKPAAAPDPGVEDLSDALVAAQAQADEFKDQYLRAKAEADNVRKRAEREIGQARRFALEGFARELLGVRDSLELGVAAAGESDADVVKVHEGMELTLKMLEQVMAKFGIEPIDPAGEKFDPDKHEAMSTQEDAEAEPNTVVNVMQKGYSLNDRVLRPAMVIVAKAPPEQ